MGGVCGLLVFVPFPLMLCHLGGQEAAGAGWGGTQDRAPAEAAAPPSGTPSGPQLREIQHCSPPASTLAGALEAGADVHKPACPRRSRRWCKVHTCARRSWPLKLAGQHKSAQLWAGARTRTTCLTRHHFLAHASATHTGAHGPAVRFPRRPRPLQDGPCLMDSGGPVPSQATVGTPRLSAEPHPVAGSWQGGGRTRAPLNLGSVSVPCLSAGRTEAALCRA